MARGAPKGHKKWGGRAKGTPNKKTEAVLNYCLAKGYKPIDAMLELAHHEDDSIKLSARRDLLSYCYPKLRSVEHSGEIEMPNPKINEENLEDRVKKLEGK